MKNVISNINLDYKYDVSSIKKVKAQDILKSNDYAKKTI